MLFRPLLGSVCPRVAILHGEAPRATRRAELEAIIAINTGT